MIQPSHQQRQQLVLKLMTKLLLPVWASPEQSPSQLSPPQATALGTRTVTEMLLCQLPVLTALIASLQCWYQSCHCWSGPADHTQLEQQQFGAACMHITLRCSRCISGAEKPCSR